MGSFSWICHLGISHIIIIAFQALGGKLGESLMRSAILSILWLDWEGEKCQGFLEHVCY